MRNSIGLGLIGWLKHIRDHRAQKVVEVLRGSEIQAQSTRNVHDWGVVGVNDHGPKSKVNYAVMASEFSDEVNELNRLAVLAYIPPVRAYSDFPPGFDHNVIVTHGAPPIGYDALAHGRN